MNTPTLRTLARLLAPWCTIRRLWGENRRLQRSNNRLVVMVLLASSKNVAQARRLSHCLIHGQQPDESGWGCPECVRELQGDLAKTREAFLIVVQELGRAQDLQAMAEQEAREAKREAERLRAERDAAQEAVRRLVRWNLIGCDTQITRDVYFWATRDGMTGPLPPLPE